MRRCRARPSCSTNSAERAMRPRIAVMGAAIRLVRCRRPVRWSIKSLILLSVSINTIYSIDVRDGTPQLWRGEAPVIRLRVFCGFSCAPHYLEGVWSGRSCCCRWSSSELTQSTRQRCMPNRCVTRTRARRASATAVSIARSATISRPAMASARVGSKRDRWSDDANQSRRLEELCDGRYSSWSGERPCNHRGIFRLSMPVLQTCGDVSRFGAFAASVRCRDRVPALSAASICNSCGAARRMRQFARSVLAGAAGLVQRRGLDRNAPMGELRPGRRHAWYNGLEWLHESIVGVGAIAHWLDRRRSPWRDRNAYVRDQWDACSGIPRWYGTRPVRWRGPALRSSLILQDQCGCMDQPVPRGWVWMCAWWRRFSRQCCVPRCCGRVPPSRK